MVLKYHADRLADGRIVDAELMSVYMHHARVRLQYGAEYIDGRGFPGAIGPEKSE